MKIFARLCLLIAIASAPAIARAQTQDDLEFFRKESYGKYFDEGETPDIEDILYQAAGENNSVEETISVFAQRIDAPADRAANYARAIIEAVRYREYCSGYYRNEAVVYDCAFDETTPLGKALLDAGYADTNGDIAFIIGRVAARGRNEENRAAFLRLIAQHPARAKIFSELFSYQRDDYWAAALILTEGPTLEFASRFFDWIAAGYLSDKSNWDGSLLALIDEARRKSRLNPEGRDTWLILSAAQLQLELKLGLGDHALDDYAKLARRDREALFSLASYAQLESTTDLKESLAALCIDLSAAALRKGRMRSARKFMAQREAIVAGNDTALSPSARKRALAQAEFLASSLNGDEIYDLFVNGEIDGAPFIAANEHDFKLLDAGAGLAFSLSSGAPELALAGADYMAKRGYTGIEQYLRAGVAYYRPDYATNSFESLTPIAPASFESVVAQWRTEIDRAYAVLKAEGKAASGPPNIVQSALEPAFEELELPEKYWSAEAPIVPVPDDVTLPVDDYALVRYANENGEHIVIYLSGALEAPGEIPAYGYWLQMTENNGATWRPAVYLGLQQFFPYQVTPGSRMPILDGDFVNIEVEVREILTESITFPPVGLEIGRQEDNRYLCFNRKRLEADSDDDGLTDLYEQRIGSDPKNADTDGDNRIDGRDSLPLTTFNANTPDGDKELAYAILSVIVGYDRGALVVHPSDTSSPGNLESGIFGAAGAPGLPPAADGVIYLDLPDVDIMGGVQPPFRIIVYNSAAAEIMRARGAPFYPVGVKSVFSRPDGSERYVIWSAGWVGGEFILRCTNGTCETETVSSWIT